MPSAGSCISYMVLLGDFLPNALHMEDRRSIVMIVASAGVLFPLTLFKHLKSFRYTSTLAVVGMLFATVDVIYRFFRHYDDKPLEHDEKGEVVWIDFSTSMVREKGGCVNLKNK